MTVHFRHHQIEQDDADQAALAFQQFKAAAAVIGQMGDMAEAFDHVRQQAALDRIIVDDENLGCHEGLLLSA